jgi:putative phosphotransacetylase
LFVLLDKIYRSSIIDSVKNLSKTERRINMSKVLIETSARHVHVSREDLDILFGEGYELTPKKDLSQPGQYACEERVAVVGSKGQFPAVSILGPTRPASQVEISASDARSIGCVAPVRESGDTAGSGACKLVGPKGEVELKEGVIAAKRHLHLTPEDAAEFGVEDCQIVKVEINTNGRSLVFGDVVARVSPKYAAAMHIDTDEANAAGIAGAVDGIVIA